MLGTSYYEAVLAIHSTQWSTLWILHPSSSEFINSSSKSHYKQITALLVFITISDNASSTGTPTYVTTATDLFGYQAL